MPNTNRATLYYAPDGFAAHRVGTELKYAVAAAVTGRVDRKIASGETGDSQHDELHFHNQDGYDEGLVHNHGWACNH